MLAGSALAGSLTRATGAWAQDDPEVSDEMASRILYEESEAGRQFKPRTLIKPFWFQRAEGVRPSATWPSDNVSFDYAHLVGQPNSEAPFNLTHDVLEQVLALNAFRPDLQRPRVLFGIRGCVLPNNANRADFAASHAVQVTRPNHLDPRCLIGVWDVANKVLALFKASTVPNVDLMEKQIEGALGCNMMPTGLHQYLVGAHRAPSQPAAFRQKTPLWVMRTKKQLLYATNDSDTVWDDLNGSLPFDNIHAAMLSSRTKPPFFSSAGCQVVAGAYDGNRAPTGAWAEFRKAAGLAHPISFTGGSASRDDGKPFDDVLITGKEAQMVASGQGAATRCLRFGASGDAVKALQDALIAQQPTVAVDKTGVVDRKTLGAVIRWQVARKLAPTGIVSTEMAASLGLKWA
jgi:hypothetical protein